MGFAQIADKNLKKNNTRVWDNLSQTFFMIKKDGLNCAKSIISLFLLIKRFQWECNMVE